MREALRRDQGKQVSRKKVARGRRKYIPRTHSNHGLAVCENTLNREFHAEGGVQKWVSDIRYLRTREGWVYLTVVLDLFDRKVIGWAFSADMETVHRPYPPWKWPLLTGRPGRV